jgi:hypothetical protein
MKIDVSALHSTQIWFQNTLSALSRPQKLRTLRCVRQFGYEEDFGSHVPPPSPLYACLVTSASNVVIPIYRAPSHGYIDPTLYVQYMQIFLYL